MVWEPSLTEAQGDALLCLAERGEPLNWPGIRREMHRHEILDA